MTEDERQKLEKKKTELRHLVDIKRAEVAGWDCALRAILRRAGELWAFAESSELKHPAYAVRDAAVDVKAESDYIAATRSLNQFEEELHELHERLKEPQDWETELDEI